MRIKMIVFLINCFCLPLFAQQTADLLLQKALYLEDFSPDIQQAIAEFEQVVAEFPENGKTAATALLHLGKIYEATDLKKAANAYRKLLKNYAIQHKIAAEARQHLNKIAPIGLPPEVKYYFDRVGIDIMSNTSYDGRLLVYTDWATGNLMLKNKYTGKIRQLTTIPAGEKFMYDTHARWSKDDRLIAFSRYVAPYHIELRLYSMKENHHRAVISKPGWLYFPQDINPSDKNILCQVVEAFSETSHSVNSVETAFTEGLYWIDSETGHQKKLNNIVIGFYGAVISPGGQYVAFNNVDNGQSKIYVYDLVNETMNAVLPAWSSDGFQAEEPVWLNKKMLLFRGYQTDGAKSLYKIQINNGVGQGYQQIIYHQLDKSFFIIAGVDERTHFRQPNLLMPEYKSLKPASFHEDFERPQLTSDWFVVKWGQPDLMQMHRRARYSLTNASGFLRYYLSPMIMNMSFSNFLPVLYHSYWYYPGTKISRYLYGNYWQLDLKITYALPRGSNARGFNLFINFELEDGSNADLTIIRYSSTHPSVDRLMIGLQDTRTQVKYGDNKTNWLFPEDSGQNPEFTYYYRITRRGTHLKVEISADGNAYKEALAGQIHKDFIDCKQILYFSGTSWFIPARSYMDIDYVYFTVLDENGNEIKDVR